MANYGRFLKKHAIITKHWNPFLNDYEYLMDLDVQEYNNLRDIGVPAKTLINKRVTGKRVYFVKVRPVPVNPMGKGMPKEDDFLVCYNIDINFTIYGADENGNPKFRRLVFTADDITDNNPLPKDKRCQTGNSVLFK